MSTLGGLFERKPCYKRNFLLENIRDVRKERIKKSQSGNSQMQKQSNWKAPQSFLKSSNPNTQLKGASIKSVSPQTVQVSKHKNRVLADMHRQKNGATKYHTDSGSQTTCELHSLCRQKDDDSIKYCSRRDGSPVYKYIDEENVPFRWTQVCPSVISHTLCHQSVQTLNEDDLDSLLEDGSIKYPTSDKPARNVKDKDIPRLEWSTCGDEGNSLPSESKSTDPSISPAEFNAGRLGQQNVDARFTKKSLSESSGKHSLTTRRDDLALLAPQSRHPFPSKTNGEGLNGKYKLQDIENKDFRNFRTDETDLKCQPREKEQSEYTDMQRKSNLEHNTAIPSLNGDGPLSRPPTSYRKGVIPKYLVKRINEQKTLSKTTENDEVNTLEEERRAALRKATKDFDALIAELNKMPVRTDTLRTKCRKIEIEKELNVLERRIRALTRISDV